MKKMLQKMENNAGGSRKKKSLNLNSVMNNITGRKGAGETAPDPGSTPAKEPKYTGPTKPLEPPKESPMGRGKKGPTGPKINKGRTGARGPKMKPKTNYFEMAKNTMERRKLRGKK